MGAMPVVSLTVQLVAAVTMATPWWATRARAKSPISETGTPVYAVYEETNSQKPCVRGGV